MKRACLLAIVAMLVPAASASAGVLSQRDGNALVTMAHAHWPSSPCSRYQVLVVGSGPTVSARPPCTMVLNARARLTASGWCRAMEPAFARLAAGSAPSVVPYRCSLAVGPAPARASFPAVPGVSRADEARAFAVADRHWPHSPCRGREQVLMAPEALLQGQTADAPIQGTTIMGQARLRDRYCVVYLSSTVAWTPTLLCTVAEHEFGHLLGLEHSADEGSVMAAVNARATDCEAAFGEAPPTAEPVAVGSPGGFGTISSR